MTTSNRISLEDAAAMAIAAGIPRLNSAWWKLQADKGMIAVGGDTVPCIDQREAETVIAGILSRSSAAGPCLR